MSLDLINHKQTTSTVDENGVITWSNPAVNVTINSKGEVYKQKTKRLMKHHNGERKRYFVTIASKDVVKKQVVSYATLFSRVVLGTKLGTGYTIVLKDKAKGYYKDNVVIIPVGELNTGISHTNLEKYNKVRTLYNKGVKPSEISKLVGVSYNTVKSWVHGNNTTQKYEQLQIQLLNKTTEQTVLKNTQEEIMFYTLHEAKSEHTTEDGAIFPTKELAEWHQTNVSKGKGNAQIVLDYNGGYVLAEQIYLQEVKYNKDKPYVNFIDVMKNNKGVISNIQEEHCVFDKLGDSSGLNATSLMLFGLDKINKLVCSKTKAEKLNTVLNKYSSAYAKLDEEHKNLTLLLKQVS